jgi:hypothetical protein
LEDGNGAVMTALPAKILGTASTPSKPWEIAKEQARARAQAANALPIDAATAPDTPAIMESDTPAIMESDTPKASPAVEFLEQLRPGGPWVLTAIIPVVDGATETITARNAKAADAFVTRHNGKRNLYYSVNPTRTSLSSKAAKTDIAAIEYLLVDLDPSDGETPQAAKARYLSAINAHKPEPTAIIDSGNGIQGLWRLSERIDISQYPPERDKKDESKLVLAPAAKVIADDVEDRCKELMGQLGSVAGTQNIDRILRLLGTINLPNKTKTDKGWIACPTKLIRFNDATCKLEDFPLPSKTASLTANDAKTEIDWAKVVEHDGWLKTVAELPDNFNAKGKMIIGHTGSIRDLSTDLKRARLIEKNYSTWSDVTFALASIFKIDGNFTNEQIAAALMCDLECNRHITKLEGAQKRRAVERALDRSYEPLVKRAARALHWRECRANGNPLPSMHNARLAIAALGIECSYDTFHPAFTG